MAKKTGKKKSTKGEINKTQEIKDFYENNPEARPAEVVEALAERGIKVTSGYVSTIKYDIKNGRSLTSSTQDSLDVVKVSVPLLKQAKTFAESCGGVDRAMKVLKMYEELA